MPDTVQDLLKKVRQELGSIRGTASKKADTLDYVHTYMNRLQSMVDSSDKSKIRELSSNISTLSYIYRKLDRMIFPNSPFLTDKQEKALSSGSKQKMRALETFLGQLSYKIRTTSSPQDVAGDFNRMSAMFDSLIREVPQESKKPFTDLYDDWKSAKKDVLDYLQNAKSLTQKISNFSL